MSGRIPSHPEPQAPARQTSRLPEVLLAFGAALGALLAASGLMGGADARPRPLPPEAVARVNGDLIRLDEYQRAVNGLVQDRRSVGAADRRMVLDRLIEDELLLQRALALGLAHDDVRVRRALTSSLLESVVNGEDTIDPTDSELKAFYESEREFFTAPGKVHVRQIWIRADGLSEAAPAAERARKAAERLREGEEFIKVREEIGDRELAPLPDTLLPAQKLGDYLGPSAIRVALTQPVGAVSDPVRSSSGYHVLQVLERQADAAPEFESIRPQVTAEFKRRASDHALRRYLDDLREQADIAIRPDLP